MYIWLSSTNHLSAGTISPKDIDTRGIMWNSAEDRARYVRSRIGELTTAIPEFNRQFTAAAEIYPDIFEDANEFTPLFEMEYLWCRKYGDQTINTNAPVSKNYCSNILQTINNDRRSFKVQVQEGADWHREFYDRTSCYKHYPESDPGSYVKRHVPGTDFTSEKVHICVVKEEDFNKTPQRSIGDIELQRFAWKVRRASKDNAEARADKDRQDIPLFKPDGSLDVGVYECDPTNWKVVSMLHEVGLIRDIERPLETGGGNIADWCNNDANAISNPCKFEPDPHNSMVPAPCKQAKAYWKFKLASIGFTPSICDTAVDKALAAAIRNGQKFRRFHPADGHMCKVRFDRRRQQAGQ